MKYEAARAFGGYRYYQFILMTEHFTNLMHNVAASRAINRDAAKGFYNKPQWEKESFLLDEVFCPDPNSHIAEKAYKKIPVAGVWRYNYHALFNIGRQISRGLPTEKV